MTKKVVKKKVALTKPQLAWVKALESGKYKWGINELQKGYDNKFCCLGVACLVAEKARIKIKRVNGAIAGVSLNSQPKVMKWLGITSGEGTFVKGCKQINLSFINDEAKRNPFKRIAKIIRSKPKGLFIEEKAI